MQSVAAAIVWHTCSFDSNSSTRDRSILASRSVSATAVGRLPLDRADSSRFIQRRHILRGRTHNHIPSRPSRIMLEIAGDQPCACGLCHREKASIIRVGQGMRPGCSIREPQCAFNQKLQPRWRKVILRKLRILRDSPVFRDDAGTHGYLDRLSNGALYNPGRKTLWLDSRRYDDIGVEYDQSHLALLRFDFRYLTFRISSSISSSETLSNPWLSA
jgi:hypothetical protein